MAGTIKDYRSMVDQPWGRMFYELIYRQLNIPDDKKVKILDFGAGFCLTANHYAEKHDVTAVEPNEEMYGLRVEGNYTLIPQGIEYLKTLEDESMDVAICHNVLEYAENKEEILQELARVLRKDGVLSIVKHNLFGRVMGSAVLGDNPKAALDLLNNVSEDSMFGNREVYSNDFLTETLSDKMKPDKIFGIRAFFGLSSNNDIKYTDDWYQSMLELEIKASSMEEFIKIAFFNHLIFRKK